MLSAASSKDNVKVVVPFIDRRGIERGIELHKGDLEARTLTLMGRCQRGGELRVAVGETDKFSFVQQSLLLGLSLTLPPIRSVLNDLKSLYR